MDAREEIEEQAAPNRASVSLLIRLFGIFAFLFGLPYLTQGVNLLIALNQDRYTFFITQLQLAFISLDFCIAAAAFLFGIGLFLGREWARQAWLVFLILTLFLQFNVLVLEYLVGRPAGVALYKWIGVVILVSIISWVYLSKASVRARFH